MSTRSYRPGSRKKGRSSGPNAHYAAAWRLKNRCNCNQTPPNSSKFHQITRCQVTKLPLHQALWCVFPRQEQLAEMKVQLKEAQQISAWHIVARWVLGELELEAQDHSAAMDSAARRAIAAKHKEEARGKFYSCLMGPLMLFLSVCFGLVLWLQRCSWLDSLFLTQPPNRPSCCSSARQRSKTCGKSWRDRFGSWWLLAVFFEVDQLMCTACPARWETAQKCCDAELRKQRLKWNESAQKRRQSREIW